MTTLRVFIAMGVATLALSSTGHARQLPPPDPADYQEFARLSPEARLDYWNLATPAVRSQLAQSHGTAWIAANAERLGPAKTATLRDAISLLTPEFHAARFDSAEALAIETELKQKVFCTLWKSDALAVLDTLGRHRQRVSWPENVFTWVTKCHMGM